MANKFLRRVFIEPIATIHMFGKRFFWNYLLIILSSMLAVATISSLFFDGGQERLSWQQAFIIPFTVWLVGPLLMIILGVIFCGQSECLELVEDFVRVVNPKFSVQQKK